jgi:UPF0716 protein FxsA
MFRVLFLLFIAIPIVEIAVLIQVGELFGLWPTVGIVIASAWLGAKYVRQQGLATMQSVQNKMANGELPSTEIVTGLMLLVAGVLLVTPGFVTDIFGLLLLVPQARTAIAKSVQQHFMVNQVGATGSFGQSPFGQPPFEQGNVYEHEKQAQENEQHASTQQIKHQQGDTVEGDFTRKDN